jgi:signal transduction histidine kinase
MRGVSPNFEERTVLRLVLDTIGEGVAVIDGAGKLVYSNRIAEQVFGLGLSYVEPPHLAVRHDRPLLNGALEVVTNGRTPFGDERHPLVRALRGEETHRVEQVAAHPGTFVSISARPLRDAHGKITGAIALARDVTALRRAKWDLERANAELVDLQRRQAELSSLIVHDLKSPLTTIIGTTEVMLEDDGASDRAKEDLRGIQQAGRSMLRMAMDLLDVAMSEDGVLLPHLEPIDVPRLVSTVQTAMSFRASERGQRIALSLDELAVPTWSLDEELMRRVLQNLVDNCIKYGPAGDTIDIGASSMGNRLELRVRDHGAGVPEEMREKIFEKYARIEGDMNGRHRDSRGLGLRFCRIAVEAHGGRIWVENNAPGAVFRVQIPMAQAAG